MKAAVGLVHVFCVVFLEWKKLQQQQGQCRGVEILGKVLSKGCTAVVSLLLLNDSGSVDRNWM